MNLLTLNEELEKGLGDGDLTLLINCTKCNTFWELNTDAVAIAIAKDARFVDYLRWVQSQKCEICNGKLEGKKENE